MIFDFCGIRKSKKMAPSAAIKSQQTDAWPGVLPQA
jgi:hypothetical protein